MTALYQLVGQLRELEALAETDLTPEFVRDTLDGLTGEIEVKAEHVAQFILNLEASADAIAHATAQMERRRTLLLQRAESVRQYLFSNMQACGITKISCPYFTLTVKKNPPKVVITDPGKVPGELYVYPPAPEPYPDKKAIAAKLKAGETVEGAHLEQGERLEVKV